MIRLSKLLVNCFVLFSFTTFTYSLWPSFLPANRVLGLVIVAVIVFMYTRHLGRKDVLPCLIIISLCLMSLMMVSWSVSVTINDAIYWSVTILLLMKLANEEFRSLLLKSLLESKDFIKFVLILNNIVVLLSFTQTSSYSSSWGGRYFKGFAFSEHSLACAACITLVLTLLIIKDYKNTLIKMIWMIPCSFAILETGARSYIISLVVIWFFLYRFCIDKITTKALLVPVIIIAAVYMIQNSGFMEKMNYTATNSYVSDNVLESFSNGRSAFWLIDLQAYFESSFINKIIGNGFDYVYFINKTRYGIGVWAHNDFINVLLCNGLLGFSVYCMPYLRLFLTSYRSMRFIDFIFVNVFILSIAFINGLFVYQHYLYSFVLLYIIVEYFSNQKNTECGGVVNGTVFSDT